MGAGGLAQMLAVKGAGANVVRAAKEIESVPGGSELLYTQAARMLAEGQGITKKDAQKIRLYCMGGPVHKARGGLTAAAERTRQGGRGDDSILLHLAPDEFNVLKKVWGKPDINPKTGIPEYGWLSKTWKKVKHAVKKVVQSPIFKILAPIALSVFLPGIGTAIGASLTGGALGATGSAIVGNAVVQGGLGAVTGGKEGAISGALSGAVTGGLGHMVGAKLPGGMSEKTADVVGSALVRGAGSSLTGGEFTEGALQGGLGALAAPMQENLASGIRGAIGLPATGLMPKPMELNMDPNAGAGLSETNLVQAPVISPEGTVSGGLMGEAPPTPTTTPAAAAGTAGKAQQAIAPAEKSDMSQYLPALLALGAAGGAGKSYQEAQPPQYPENFNEPLPRYALNRRRMNPMSASSYYTYGQPGAPESGQHLFLDPDPFAGEEVGGLAAATGAGAVGGGSIILPPGDVGAQQRQALERQGWSFNPTTNEMVPPQKAPQTAAHGAYVRGPGTGRSDDIDAKLSDGEYIVDAETVSLLGDGSGSAGARRLDEMRRNLRQHKAANLKKGEFTHKAKMPMKYMGGMNRLRRSQIAAGRA